jgi:hypothetical protein
LAEWEQVPQKTRDAWNQRTAIEAELERHPKDARCPYCGDILAGQRMGDEFKPTRWHCVNCKAHVFGTWDDNATLDRTDREREALAALEHEQWAHWTRYMLDNLTPENIERWRRQCDTPYIDLSERERESDRGWADRVIAILAAQEENDG